MRHFFYVIIAIFITVSPATANCFNEIQSLINDGPWDPFTRDNRREKTLTLHPDGTQQPDSDVLWDGPTKSINCTPNGCFMAIGYTTWSGPSFEGPWTSTPDIDGGGVEPEDFVRKTSKRLAQSVKEPECLGQTELDGKITFSYRFLSKPEPNEHGSWWGGRYTVWVEQKSNRLLRLELADGIASWAPEPSKNIQITTVIYDNTIKIEAPNL